MLNSPKPFLCLTFANDKFRYLNGVPNETNDLAALFRGKENLCTYEAISNIRPHDLHDVVSKKGKEMCILHYGGHAD
ncbi:MAG: hypothetical protein ACKVTZ_00445, partial [Bacteroidia bacterium]